MSASTRALIHVVSPAGRATRCGRCADNARKAQPKVCQGAAAIKHCMVAVPMQVHGRTMHELHWIRDQGPPCPPHEEPSCLLTRHTRTQRTTPFAASSDKAATLYSSQRSLMCIDPKQSANNKLLKARDTHFVDACRALSTICSLPIVWDILH